MKILEYFHFVLIRELEDDILAMRRLSKERLCSELKARSIVALFITEGRYSLGESG